MTLETYHAKRDFHRTREPRGASSDHSRGAAVYVIQKHAASRLHYDFRLELDGVLLSWAVPKGPSLDPKVKRLAMQTEDHPIEYGGFEGTIPKGEYGGGTVMVWDSGTWEPSEGRDAKKDYARGRLSFVIHGKKLHGRWHLVRSGTGDQKKWILFKGADEEAKREGSIVDEAPLSALTSRTMEEIAASADRTWHSKNAPKVEAPSPELATLVKEAPEGTEWLHEIKLDGYRILAHVDHGKVILFSRNGKEWTDRMPSVARAVSRVKAKQAVIDGEVCVVRANGTTDFQALQNALGTGGDLTYFAFDLLEKDGRDLRGETLESRKAQLEKILSPATDVVRFSEHVEGEGKKFFKHACELGVEGIVSKRRDAPYRAGRGHDWLKVKCIGRQEFVIVGFTSSKSGRNHFGALLLATREEGALRYVGKVGTGFSSASLDAISTKLQRIERGEPPQDLEHAPRARSIRWVEPELVCEVDYGSITREGILRHAAFRGLREDKSAREVKLEKPKARPHLTNAEKILYPESGITKGDVAAYLARVAPFILPHIAHRPLMLVRCPNGIGKCFVQKHDKDEIITVDDEAGLLALAQAGVLEIHTRGCTTDDIDRADLLVLDLDPDPEVPWTRVIDAAERIRERLAAIHIEPFVKTTGGKGLHVCARLPDPLPWDDAKAFAREVAASFVREDPEHFVLTMSKAARRGKIFIDYLRNGRGATFIAPYSMRARAKAPIAMPLEWSELDAKTKSDRYNVRNVGARLDALPRDPWERLANHEATMTSGSSSASGANKRSTSTARRSRVTR